MAKTEAAQTKDELCVLEQMNNVAASEYAHIADTIASISSFKDELYKKHEILAKHIVEIDKIDKLSLKINTSLKKLFKKKGLILVDFKLEFGYNSNGQIVLGDEISPDNCRLWDLNQKNGKIVSLDKDRFRNDLGGFIEAYSEINKRINNLI